MMKRVLYTVVGLLLVVVAAVAGWLWHVASNSDALRQITLEQCVPGQRDRQPVSYTHLTLPTICSV